MNRKGIAELAGSAALGAWAAFGVLALFVSGKDGSPRFLDHDLLTWSVGHRPEMAVAVARGLTATGTGVVPYALVVLAGLLAGRTRRRRLVGALLAAATLATGQAVRYGVMELVARARPPYADWQTHASGWSFPSGHTTTAALTAGLVILALCLRAPHGHVPLCLAVACWGAGVGLTRVFLGVHWFTDVLGGWLFAVGWLGLWVCAAAWWLPLRLIPGTGEPDPPPTTDTAGVPLEKNAPQDPDRRGRSRPA
ncbi:phosphoesterase [Streptomyces cellostaticus]|uniref:Phosphoesterase n=1 Tax=Streptomyces cellostaticus TaxID=67285 RepID=A0A124HDC8_9ACTN|nr:phosphatase PAP2 family protein [Streptomyces cellostaticus]KUM97178.1 phosphoesterase [Streptomyces cellostaticus]GHI03800.1 phosphatase PAP2 family protein [Streptomyces cellostaticus]